MTLAARATGAKTSGLIGPIRDKALLHIPDSADPAKLSTFCTPVADVVDSGLIGKLYWCPDERIGMDNSSAYLAICPPPLIFLNIR